MGNCIEADNEIYVSTDRLSILENKVDRLEKFIFYPCEPTIPERVCDKCNGTGSFIDDGIL